MTRPTRRFLGSSGLCLLAGSVLFLAGCTRAKPALAPTKPPEVVVDTPIIKEVTDYEDFTGRTEVDKGVELRSRVTGYLQKINFIDGEKVDADHLLFQLQPEPYKAEYEKAAAMVEQAEVHRDRTRKYYDRLAPLRNSKTISQEEWDRVEGEYKEAAAAVDVAKRARDLAKVNYDSTFIRAPFAGRMSRTLVYPGALIKADDTIMTYIATVEPVYVQFDVDVRTVLRIRELVKQGKLPNLRRLIEEGRLGSASERETLVQVALPNEEDHSLSAAVNFIDTRVDPGTATLQLRAKVIGDNHLLPPGLFVRVRLPIGLPQRSVLVPEEAIGTDQGQKFVYVVNDKNEVVYRPVKLGQQYERYRVIESGVGAKDRIIISGLQRVRPGKEVVAKPAAKAPAARPVAETRTPAKKSAGS
jgi:multidrug efflux system membrane fusion protein